MRSQLKRIADHKNTKSFQGRTFQRFALCVLDGNKMHILKKRSENVISFKLHHEAHGWRIFISSCNSIRKNLTAGASYARIPFPATGEATAHR